MLAAFLITLVILSCWLFMQRTWWMPELASVHGVAIDRVFLITLVITGVMFILLQLVLAFFIVRFGQRGDRKAQYSVRPRLEKRFALYAGIIIFLVDVTIFVLGDSEWFKAWGAAPDNPVIVEATSEQFVWNFRYPGADGVFGKTDPQLISTTNTLGVDSADKASADDILSINQLHIPEGKPVKMRLRSKDVIHSFYLPNLRVKQDTVPGMQIDLLFIPSKPGQFEIACNQLCGLGHYRMRAFLTVESSEAFNNWLSGMAQGGK
jgi:cytochrome c oxidase subunit 2